ncbi:MAG: nucleotide exchange factor GrpE [Bacteroidales bacterium]|nr:nucleotide exchange factor GrpE [Bacteroidales bacterium]
MTEDKKAKDQNQQETDINATNAEPDKNEDRKTKNNKKNRSSSKKPSEVQVLEEKVGELEENLAELNDKYLRLFSEFDNYRKRTIKERLDLIDTAAVEVIKDLLPVMDDFERAFKANEAKLEENQSNLEGFKLIYNKLKGILNRRGLEPMKSIGESFDTDFHEALTNIPAPSGDLKGKVVDEIEKGYMLKGKVIRFAKVVVGQ